MTECEIYNTVDNNMVIFIGGMMFNATFNNISVICGSQFYWWRKPPTCYKSLTNFITCLSSTPHHEHVLNSQL